MISHTTYIYIEVMIVLTNYILEPLNKALWRGSWRAGEQSFLERLSSSWRYRNVLLL